MNDDYLWDPSASPDAEIAALERVLRPLRFAPADVPFPVGWRTRRSRFISGAAAAAVFVAVASGLLYWKMTQPAPWSIENIEGIARLSGKPVNSESRLVAGGTIETDSRSAARIAVGGIGIADIGPSSKVQLLRADSGQHRLELMRGTIYARIWARPRFFVVQTPSGTATDLGCIYTMSVDSAGNGRLSVSEGEVEIAGGDVGVLVPAGNTVALIAGKGPGLPYPISSSVAFRAAVAAADSAGYDGEATQRIVQLASRKETLTLWHSLSRADAAQRQEIYSRLAVLAKPPAGVTEDGIVALDQSMLAAWEKSMRGSWSSEPGSWWRRILFRLGLRKPAVWIGSAT